MKILNHQPGSPIVWGHPRRIDPSRT